jgi:GNAT superfamily N-acetyltransferase
MSISIREALPADAGPVGRLLREVFAETYGAAIRGDVLRPYLAREFAAARVARELGRPSALRLVANVQGALAGVSWLAGRPAPIDTGVARSGELEKLYVSGRWRGQGVANLLLGRSIELARQQGWNALWLAVWEQNPRAIAFYQRHGFAPAGHMPIYVDHVEFRDLVMLRGLDD